MDFLVSLVVALFYGIVCFSAFSLRMDLGDSFYLNIISRFACLLYRHFVVSLVQRNGWLTLTWVVSYVCFSGRELGKSYHIFDCLVVGHSLVVFQLFCIFGYDALIPVKECRTDWNV
jgi:hypothetical protein